MDLNIRDLRFFYIIAKEGSLSEASMIIGRSQPALSKSIQRLEKEVGMELFVRNKQGMVLTMAGEILQEKARMLCTFVDQTGQDLENFSRGFLGKIRIGCVPTVAEYLLPSLCRIFLSENPLVTLEIEENVNEYLWNNLQNRQLDIIFTTKTINYDNVFVAPIIDDVVVAVASKDHPIFKINIKQVLPNDLIAYKWLLPRKNTATRHWVEQFFISRGLSVPNIQIEMSSLRLIPKILVENKQLISFIPRRYLLEGGSAYQKLKEIKIENMQIYRHFMLVRLKDRIPSPIIDKAINLIKSKGNKLFL